MASAPSSRDGSRRGVYAKTPQRRREIVEAAAAVFSAHGYSGGSLRQIAKDIGVSVTSVMHHFPSKELLLEAVLEYADSQAVQALDLDAARDGLRGTIARLVENGREHPHLLRLLAVLSAEASAAEHPAHAWFVERYQRVEDAIMEWASADPDLAVEPGSLEVRAAARRIAALWDGLQLQWLIRGDFDLAGELSEGVEALAARAVRADAAAAPTGGAHSSPLGL
jgi:AcrR family transcriptional regulator